MTSRLRRNSEAAFGSAWPHRIQRSLMFLLNCRSLRRVRFFGKNLLQAGGSEGRADMKVLTTLTVSKDRGAALITLNRPERLNAINHAMIADMHEVLDELAADPNVAAIVVSGAGRAFSSGMDLKDDAAGDIDGVAGWRNRLGQDLDFLLRFWDYPKPTIAAVHGYCLAAGCELALCCDVTIAEEGAYFGEPELLFGSVITAMMMPWLTGPKIAKELLLSADDRITAERAERLGLVNRVVPAGQHVKAALALAQRMASMDMDAVRLTKEAINRTFEIGGLKEALRANLDLAVQIETLQTPSRQAFKDITRRQGLKAALAWRNARVEGNSP
jgi:enoyl-CoA hydratase